MFYRVRRLIHNLFPRLNVEYFYLHNLEKINTVEPRVSIEIGVLTFLTIDRIHEVKYLNLNRLKKRLERGDKCYVAYYKDRVISYHWVQYSGSHYVQQENRRRKVKNKDFWIYHVRVSNDFKGNRVNGAVYCKILIDAKAQGLQNAWVYTNKYNYANRKGLERLGFNLDYISYSLKFKNSYYKLFSLNVK